MLTEEEKEKANQNMISDLTPRAPNGLKYPMIFLGEKSEILYPCVTPDENGLIDPMFYLEDFVDGKHPPNLRYEPGCQPEFVPVGDPRYMASIRYDNPELNLPVQERRVLWGWRNGRKVVPMQVTISGGSRADTEDKSGSAVGVKPADAAHRTESADAGPDVEVVNLPSGRMNARTSDDEFFLANFSVEAVEHRFVHKSSKAGDISDEYEIRVNDQGNARNIVLAVRDIGNVVAVIQRVMPSCMVSSSVKKANTLIENHVRKQLFDLPGRHYVRVSGFTKIDGAWVFAHDGAEAPGGKVVFQTGRTISADTGVTPKGAFRNLMELLNISEKLMLMLPLILVAHLSPMFNLFEAAGHIPRFVVFVAGRTGSLKTSTALVVFRLFEEQPNSPGASFKDTEVALEIKVGEGYGMVILLDDYRPPVTAVDGKSNLSKLESVVRAVGDRIGKSRSNPELGKAKEFLPTSCVVVTGEDLGGTQSSQLRMLILPIEKDDIDGKKLKRFQDDPLLLSTHMFYFLRWVGECGDAIIEFVRESFEAVRSSCAAYLKEARAIDTAVVLMLTARILHSYGCEIGAIEASGSKQLLHEWDSAILAAVIASEAASKTTDPVCMYLQALFDLWERREIDIARDLESYEAGKHIGYASGENLWLWHREVYKQVVRYWQKLSVLFPLSVEKINEHLNSAGLIKVSYEGAKKLYVCKSSLPKRSRLLVLNEQLARNYLENESN